ncbi:hypothetical protein CMMCAS05_02375 [Clavibacter michiganensis subsp. michiganensis]|nr:hypothetical protein CMMCAS04_05395 [Clavibacter michiganensis subsp. michiganensis]OUD95294.1 hypothetical protein CMMCAS05_02375 [Clavibacter michiganensis subsp. michiganensis]
MPAARTVASVSASGTMDQRPAAVGGPVRVGMSGRGIRPPRYMRPRGARCGVLCAVDPPASSARSGDRVSFVTRPAHTRSHSAVTRAVSSVDPTASLSCRKK